jgi:hypothetical protein
MTNTTGSTRTGRLADGGRTMHVLHDDDRGRRPGTVLVVTDAGQTIGFNPARPLDWAIRDLADQALATGQDKLQRLRIEQDAADYIGLSALPPAGGAAVRRLSHG